MQEPQREDLLMKSLKEVVEREYSMHASNWVLAGGIANANKNSDPTSKKYKTDHEKELIRLFTAMCNKRIELEMIYDFETIRKKFENTYPNSKIKFSENHYRFLKSNGESGRHLPVKKGEYFNFMSQWFESEIMLLQQMIDKKKELT